MNTQLADELEILVEAFEADLAENPTADLASHLPLDTHPQYLAVLTELIRVDLSRGWATGRQRRLDDYRHRFPAAFADAERFGEVAFEEFRQRRLAGEVVEAVEYARTFGIDTSAWPAVPVGAVAQSFTRQSSVGVNTPLPTSVLAGFGRSASSRAVAWSLPAAPPSESVASERWSTPPAFPAVGTEFLGFRLEDELGRGAFGRVYLARQADLSGRPVALKVSCDIVDESRTLAQLQHPSIVPIYSYHQAGQLQAACMPYFGGTTLAQVVSGLSGKAALPHSGRELKSTVNQGRLSTHRSTTHPSSEPGDMLEPSPAPARRIVTATEDEWARLDGMSYIEAVLHLGEQLADGLAHAHERGILHRDLKPANVLLTDDGRPMLLDFNLAEDTKVRGTVEGARVGGTLPYMSPEQLQVFKTGRGKLDGRCDVYSLGVVLFELITGRHPFSARRGSTPRMVEDMIADRQSPPSVRTFNKAASWAVDGIIAKCLAADPANRYQSAADLRDDLNRQLAHRPLLHAAEPSVWERGNKWVRRHPRLAGITAVAVVAVVVLSIAGGVLSAVHDRGRDDRARVVLSEHTAAFADAQLRYDDRNQSRPRLGEVQESFRELLARYGVPEDGRSDAWLSADPAGRLPQADRERVRADVGEAFYMMAQTACLQAELASTPTERAERLNQAETWHAAAQRHAADRCPRALQQQRADLASLAGRPDATDLARGAETVTPGSPRDSALLGTRHARAGRSLAAADQFNAATRADPTNLTGWFVRGTTHLDLGQPERAAECFSACVSLKPGYAPAWLNRGLCYSRLGWHAAARDEFDKAVELDPKLTQGYVERAFSRDALGDHTGAVEDFTRAIDTGAAGPRIYFLRTAARRRTGDEAGAQADVRDGMTRPCGDDELNWIARSEVRLNGLDAHAALGGFGGGEAVRAAARADVEHALALNPNSEFALQQHAAILSVYYGRDDEALVALDRLVKSHPESARAIVDRAVLLARGGNMAAAIKDVETALLLDTKPPILYQAACVYALSSRTDPEAKREAIRSLRSALRAGYGLDVVDIDTDLDLLRDDPSFRALVGDAKRLYSAPSSR